jgi:hypothetical protein
VLDSVRGRFPAERTSIVFNGHSGGGSLIFGYLNTLTTIPQEVERIAFLDSNYAYETEKHRDKLANWLKASGENVLVVLAYNDAIARLDGKPFVSEIGGTWGRCKQMFEDFSPLFSFRETKQGDITNRVALSDRFVFHLHENPQKKILHTVQVERNGFIESMLVATPFAGKGYQYFGDRAYQSFILNE